MARITRSIPSEPEDRDVTPGLLADPLGDIDVQDRRPGRDAPVTMFFRNSR